MPPVALPPPGHNGPEQSTLQKLKMGALMGGTVGLSIGFIFGTFSVLRNGAGSQGALSQIAQTMLASSATFGLFMSVGTPLTHTAGDTHGGTSLRINGDGGLSGVLEAQQHRSY
ncbi:MAG: subunit of TIM23 translocase complex [Cyphobasidiales sp. Tagirdzhanova-0007]|nr:MAG: subunit of TIM23 translocase complex [Cyphobasidiales sp. Tagirdzhanova-0007]